MSDDPGDEMGPAPHDPHPAASAVRRRVRVAAAVVWRGGLLLLTRRPPGGPLGLQWELPGGKIEAGESPEQALVRELREELGVRATALEVLDVDTHDYPHGLDVEVSFVRCELESYEFTPSTAVHEARWLAPGAIDLASVLAGDRRFLGRLGAERT